MTFPTHITEGLCVVYASACEFVSIYACLNICACVFSCVLIYLFVSVSVSVCASICLFCECVMYT